MIAVIIPDYNMPEWVDDLRNHIRRNTWIDYKIIVVSNGNWGNLRKDEEIIEVPDKLEMTHAILQGLHYADSLEYVKKITFDYYFILTTSVIFEKEIDYLSGLISVLQLPNAVMASPSIEGTAWDELGNKGQGIRKVWGVDNNAVMIDAKWFNSIGRYNPELVIGWGSSFEVCYLARKQGKGIYVNDNFPMSKKDGVAHEMGRRDVLREERNRLGAEEMTKVLSKKYGLDFLERLGHDYR